MRPFSNPMIMQRHLPDLFLATLFTAFPVSCAEPAIREFFTSYPHPEI